MIFITTKHIPKELKRFNIKKQILHTKKNNYLISIVNLRSIIYGSII